MPAKQYVYLLELSLRSKYNFYLLSIGKYVVLKSFFFITHWIFIEENVGFNQNKTINTISFFLSVTMSSDTFPL